MPTWPLERKPIEAMVLAVLAIAAVAATRYPVESRSLFLAEMLVLAAVQALAALRHRPTDRLKSKHRRAAVAGLTVAVPVIFAVIARILGSPIAYEMTALTTFGAAALALSTGNNRSRAMSLVASGFLTLFAVSIADSHRAVWIAIAWMTICVWHLVANHWERLELCQVENVRRGTGIRPVSVLAAVAICIVTGLVMRDRMGESDRLTIGFMPTSGGTQWSDPAARSGVGTGDAAIAAKDHAESFGAVESDLFLESTESTLFDMFNDTIGEPKKKTKWERRQSMISDQIQETHAKTAKSEKGGSSFSTDRTPVKKHLHLDDASERAIVQWAGPAGIRLAMNRYDTFDGVDWTNEAGHRDEKLTRRKIGDAAWFCDSTVGSLTESTTQVNLLKVLRLDSTRLPVPMMTSAVHIKDVDRQDFFAIEDDGSLFMPGRDKVPHLTVLNVASTKVMEDEIWSGLHRQRSTGAIKHDRPNPLASLTTRWTADLHHPYQKLQAIVSGLRDNFTFDRSAAAREASAGPTAPLSEFLRTRRGGDHLFATAAALMAREIGLQSRLVTGFYVRPSTIDIAAGHTNVMPDDVHVWAEIRLNDGRWIAIEPTPGYRPPEYAPSTWLAAQQFAAAKWPHALGLLAIAGLIFATRIFWLEVGLAVAYRTGSLVMPRRRLSLAMRVLQTRAKYAGCARVAGRPQRDWLLAITSTNDPLRDVARRFCDAADRAAFAGDDDRFHEHTVSKELMMKLKTRVLRQLATEASV